MRANVAGMKVISRFVGEYAFLSNFYVEPDGTHVEGEFQAQKAVSPEDRDTLTLVYCGLAPRFAKLRGRRLRLRQDWNEVRIDVMRELVRKKFHDHPELAAKLKATGDTLLVESNTWGDRFWGAYRGEGENHLGKILMEVRSELHGVSEN